MLNFTRALIFSLLFFTQLVSAQSVATSSLSKKLKPQFKQKMIHHNLNVMNSGDQFNSMTPSGLFVKRPVAEYEDTGFLIFFDQANFSSADIKSKLIENLPKGVTAIIYSDESEKSQLEGLYRYYSQLAPEPSQVKIINIPNSIKMVDFENGFGQMVQESVYPNGFWSRDTIPVPVLQMANVIPTQALSDKFTVVDAKYYHFYEPDQLIADYFSSPLLAHDYYFEGGNFMVNAQGDCIVINTEDVDIIPNSIFNKTYGCSNLIRLPYLKGIGHADESVKFISDNLVLTDDLKYKKILEQKGFTVKMLPRPKRDLETYVNSLIINGTVWVPTYQQAKTDQAAIDVYENLGLKVIPVDSSLLSNEGAGSVHCITMTYPSTISFNELMEHFGGANIIDSTTIGPDVALKVKALKQERQDSINTLNDSSLDAYLDSLYMDWDSELFN